MTREAIQCLPIVELRAIVATTNPRGQYWQQLVWAKDELARRNRSR